MGEICKPVDKLASGRDGVTQRERAARSLCLSFSVSQKERVNNSLMGQSNKWMQQDEKK